MPEEDPTGFVASGLTLTDFNKPGSFNPKKAMQRIGKDGKRQYDYVDVGDRLRWVNSDHPDWAVRSRLTEFKWDGTRGYAVAHAEIVRLIPALGGFTEFVVAENEGTETSADFGDFAEKALTKAIGRALASIGYSTDVARDFNVGEDYSAKGRYADGEREDRTGEEKPVDRTTATKQQPPATRKAPEADHSAPPAAQAPSHLIPRPTEGPFKISPMAWATRIKTFEAETEDGATAFDAKAFNEAWKASGKTAAQLNYMLGIDPDVKISKPTLLNYLHQEGKPTLRELVDKPAEAIPA